MTPRWISSDLRTGRVLADLPGLTPEYPLRRTISQYETGTAHLMLDGAPENWERAVLEGAAVLHCYDDLDSDRNLQWSGIVTQQVRDTSNDFIDLSLATGESYFDRRYVGDVSYSAEPQNTLIADLLTRYVVEGAEPGIPITVRYMTAGGGTVRDEFWRDNDNATVYARMQQMSAIQGGPEWTVEWVWSADLQHIYPILLIGDRIGQAAPADLGPQTTWSMPGCVTTARQIRSFQAGKGANNVTAYSSGQGDATPTSGPVRATSYLERPTFEYRWNPSQSETDPVKLEQWAAQAAAMLAPGMRSIALTAARSAAPQYGSEWRMGDDFGYQIGGPDGHGNELVPMFPGGLSGVGRSIAYELSDANTITPIVAEQSVYSEGGT